MIPRGIRLNNPGNIVKSNIRWQGKVVGYDRTFESFDTPQNGLLALCDNLLSYQRIHDCMSVKDIITRWTRTDVEPYIENVAAAMNVKDDYPLDLGDAPTLARLATAIIHQEQGQVPYPASMITQAAMSSLGLGPEPA